MLTVGVPRALFYFRYYPLVKAFLDSLGVGVVTTPPTNRAMLGVGSSHVVAETCLPVKAYCGHLASLGGQVDYVLVPSVRCVEPGLYACVKLFALPDMARAIPGAPPVLDFLYDASIGAKKMYRELFALGRRLGCNSRQIESACVEAVAAHRRYEGLLASGLPPARAIAAVTGEGSPPQEVSAPPAGPVIALVGHAYNLFDDYLNHGLINKLEALGARVVTSDTVSEGDLAEGVTSVVGTPYWMCEKEITGAAGHYLKGGLADGVIVLSSFGCAPDSMIVDALQRRFRHGGCVPLLCLNMDEHTAEAGLLTRLEAFTDTLRRRRPGSRPRRPAQRAIPPTIPGPPPSSTRPRVSLPPMGTTIVALQVMFGRLGVDMVLPPPYSRRTLDIGTKLSPEYVCIPYKLTLGSTIEALEMGANTPILLSGPNNCRFGYYHKLQEQVLRERGYTFRMLAPEISGRTIKGVIHTLQDLSGRGWLDCFASLVLALLTMGALDEVEREVQRLRPIEAVRGATDKIWEEAQSEFARVRSRGDLAAVKRRALGRLAAVPVRPGVDPLRVCIVGEIYVVHEPFINHDMERQLAKLGVEANRSEQVSQWLVPSPALLLEQLGLGHQARIKRAEKPYLQYWSGETVGQTVMADEDGYDGVIQLAPFTCTPEVVAQNLLPKVRQNVDIPLITFIFDEQTGRAGVSTRLEAFVDLLYRRRQAGRQRAAQRGIAPAL